MKQKQNAFFNKKIIVDHEVTMLKANGVANTSKTTSKGTRRDRVASRMLKRAKENEDGMWKLAFAQCLEENSPTKIKMNESIQELLLKSSKRKLACANYDSKIKLSSKLLSTSSKKKKLDDEPFVKPFTKSNAFMKSATGFVNEKIMLAFIVTINNSKMEKLRETTSPLTWHEENYLCFEVIWGRSVRR